MWRSKLKHGTPYRMLNITTSGQIKKAFKIACLQKSVTTNDAATVLLREVVAQPAKYLDQYVNSDRYTKRRLLMYTQGVPTNIVLKLSCELMDQLKVVCRERKLAVCHMTALLIQDFSENPDMVDLSPVVQQKYAVGKIADED